ncbi:Uncharacterised protein [Chlamydia trachomatis]|nr:Uncharacterised protein [Chlamydia trachomatis]
MNWPTLGDFELLAFLQIQRFAGHVEHVALGDIADGNRDRCTRVSDNSTTN